MRFLVTLAALAALSIAPAAGAQPADKKVGQRNGTPEQLFSGIGEGSTDAALEQEIAAAAAFPLGTLQNPVRVGGPEGEQAYIARLRCANGEAPKAFDRRNGEAGAFGSVVGIYTLDCGTAAPGRAQLVMDMYHAEHREDRAPAGFAIAPR
jgi:hypothetical protein